RKLRDAERLRMREIEAQPIRCDQRALLRHVTPEHLAQRCMQQVRSGMIEADRLAARGIDVRLDTLPHLQPTGDELAEVRIGRAALACILHREARLRRRLPAQLAAVTDLAAR